MAPALLNTLSLFSGIGGLERGVGRAIGLRLLGHVERDAFAAAVLLARMEDSSLEPAPVWCGNIEEFDCGPFVGRVDLICGGFPCQDLSVAGNGAGFDGARSGLWSEFARIIREIRPRYVFVENVSGLLIQGRLGRVRGDLAALRFDSVWTSLRASDPSIGAPHRRERVFILAHADEHGPEGQRGSGLLDGERPTLRRDADGRCRAEPNVADAGRCRDERRGVVGVVGVAPECRWR